MLTPYEQLIATEQTLDYYAGEYAEVFDEYVQHHRTEHGSIIDPDIELNTCFPELLHIAGAISPGSSNGQTLAIYRSMLFALQLGQKMLPGDFYVPFGPYFSAVSARDDSMVYALNEANTYMVRCQNIGKLFFRYQGDVDPMDECPVSVTTFALFCMLGEREMARKLLETEFS